MCLCFCWSPCRYGVQDAGVSEFWNSRTCNVFFFQARGYSELTFVPPTFFLHFCNGMDKIKIHGKYEEGYFWCFCVSCLSHSCLRVREFLNNGISGLPEALKNRDYIFAMVLNKSIFQESIRSRLVFFGARCFSHSRSLVREYFNNVICGLPEVSQFSKI